MTDAANIEQRFEVETPFGPVWLWGRDTGRPLVIVATGAFAESWVFDRLQLTLPAVDVVRFHLPSNHCPALTPNNLGTISRGLTTALETLFPNRPTAIFGLSTGALVALAAKAPQVRRLVLAEPFLRTAHVWPLHDLPGIAKDDAQRDLLWNVLGVAEGRVEDRDYRHLLDRLSVPTVALVGRIPLGDRRAVTPMPSLVDEADRSLLRAHPMVRVFELEGGHNLATESLGELFRHVATAANAILAEPVKGAT
jgi:hypothetical protein